MKVNTLLAIVAGVAVLPLVPAAGLAQPPLPVQVIVSDLGDFDCFGYGLPTTRPTDPTSPCGSLVGSPIQETDDAVDTDVTLACPSPSSVTYTHTFTVPEGGTILGAVWAMNVGGLETANFSSFVSLDGLPIPLPDTGSLGTALVAIPIIPPLTNMLEDGQLVVRLTRGSRSACDDVFVDFSLLSILVSLLAF